MSPRREADDEADDEGGRRKGRANPVEGRTVHSFRLSLGGAHAIEIEIGAAIAPGNPARPARRPGAWCRRWTRMPAEWPRADGGDAAARNAVPVPACACEL